MNRPDRRGPNGDSRGQASGSSVSPSRNATLRRDLREGRRLVWRQARRGTSLDLEECLLTARQLLLTEDEGAKAVIDAVARLKRKSPRREQIAKALNYLRNNRHRMRYAEWKRAGYMIGSGVVEAACKTLVAQRLKLSGMRWGARGAQTILTMRGWDQSDRFDAAWALVAATYHTEVQVLANVVDLTPKPERKRRRA